LPPGLLIVLEEVFLFFLFIDILHIKQRHLNLFELYLHLSSALPSSPP
jgi:hypothetical protein